MTTRLWDLRYPGKSFALLKAHIGAIRSLRFRCADRAETRNKQGACVGAGKAAQDVLPMPQIQPASSHLHPCRRAPPFPFLPAAPTGASLRPRSRPTT